MNLIKNDLQKRILFAQKFESSVVNYMNSGRAANAIIRRIDTMQDIEIQLSRHDVMTLNRIAEIKRTGTYHNPFDGGAALSGSRMPVSLDFVKRWVGLK